MHNGAEPNGNNMANTIGVAVLGKLPRFDGRSSVKKFIKSIEKRSLLENWDEESRARIMRYLCTDLAEAFIDSNPELETASFTDLCENLNARFGPKISRPEAYAELMAIRQNRQAVDDYAGQIESTAAGLSDIITEVQDAGERDELLISVFMSGLDPALKRSLVVNNYDTFTSVVRAAKRFEKTFDSRRNINTVHNQYDVPRPATPYNARPTPPGNHDRYASYEPPTARDRYASFRPPHERNAVICWYCGKRGHIQRFCRQSRNRRVYADPPRDNFGPQRDRNYERQSKN